MRTRLSRLSIRWILPAAIVAPALILALLLIFLAYRTEQRSASELAADNSRQIHETIENHLNHLVDLPPAINQLVLARLREGSIRLDQPDASREPIFQTLHTFPDVSSMALGCAQGQATFMTRYPGETTYDYTVKSTPEAMMREYAMDSEGQIGPNTTSTFKYNTVMRPWYRAAIEANGPTWGNVYLWLRDGKGVVLGIPYVQPYRDGQGKLLGVVNSEITLADISAFLSRLKIGKTGIAFIVERDGNLVASSIGIDCMKDGTDRLAAEKAPDSRIALAAAQLSQQFGSLQGIEKVRAGHADIAGQPMQMVVSSFRNRRNLDWLVVTLVPDADYLADFDRARNRSMLIGAVAVLAALGLGIAVAMWLLRPILAVVAHARKVGAGELDARITRHDYVEITQLSHALNEMADGLHDRLRLRHALNLAMEVQQSLLPGKTPKIRGLDISARAKYCDETGGDYYDYLDVEGMGPDLLMVAIGDVTGHGIAAALLMSSARGVLRSQGRNEGSLGTLLTRVNDHLVADTSGDRFMTMFLGLFDVANMSMKWASAGHDQPLIYDPKSGFLTEIDINTNGLPLGVMPSEVYKESTYTGLRPGQVLLIGTDGLWEAKNHAGEEFGKERVGKALAASIHLSAAEIDAAIFHDLRGFCDQRANEDDVTYVVIKIIGKPDAAMS